ncbi:dirigent protein 2-like [Canna indica]|uniref:Dirigent protein n=1 Tax=Canna indica TaxID=4628 RepID=A0AAQ3QDU5_9LILI|nr:dirigent protein 2-like [Canna indica]
MASSPPPNCFFFLLLLLPMSITLVAAADDIHLHFFFHEKVAGTPNATSIAVVDKGGFGTLKVYDNALRVTAELDSAIIGRGQGMGAYSTLTSVGGALTVMNLVFTAGEYSGSTLALMGVFTMGSVSERSIVGGSGQFRLARGYALTKVVSPTGATTTVAEFDVYLTISTKYISK